MAKRATPEEIARFLQDLDLLRKILDNSSIAKTLGIHPSNLSSYRSGKKTPGKTIINKFYMAFKEKLDELGGKKYEHEQAGSEHQKIEDPATPYGGVDMASVTANRLVNTLITNNEKLWNNNEQLWKDKEKVWNTFSDMYTSNKEIIHGLLTSNASLVKSNNKLAGRVAPRRGFSNNATDTD